ncbi:phosphotransferase enzyme family protein [Micromonospora sp. NPDC003197]
MSPVIRSAPPASAHLTACLSALGPWAGEVTYHQVLSSRTVETVGLIRNERRFVLKIFPADTCLVRLSQRLTVLTQLRKRGQLVPLPVDSRPVPAVDAETQGRAWLVLTEYVDGDPLSRPNAPDFRLLGRDLGELHAELRNITVDRSWQVHADCSLEVCRPSGTGTPTLTAEPETGTPTRTAEPARFLQHGDLHTGNVVRQGARFAFFDFDEMAVGDQLDDVAALLGFPSLRAYATAGRALVAGYAAARGDRQRLDGPDLLFALARRFDYLAAIQDDRSAAPRLTGLARELREHAEAGDGLPGWLTERAKAGSDGR